MFFVRKVFSQSFGYCVNHNIIRHVRRATDPGISHRRRALQVHEDEEMEDYEDLESDFMAVHKSHKDYERDLGFRKEREKLLIVKQKYFKHKFPNFLTWHDKEQIRYLHRTDPEEWTIERLSEGFPALPETIQKITKSDWTREPLQIANHDASVQKNWKMFKNGQMTELPQDLMEHLNKFSNRALQLQPFVAPVSEKNVVEIKKPKVTEFADIINSYNKLNSDVPQTTGNLDSKMPNSNTLTQTSRRRPTTLNQLQSDLTNRIESGKKINEDQKNLVISLKSQNVKCSIEPQKGLIEVTKEKYEMSTIQKREDKDYSHLTYPDRITIPKNIYKKGNTYKLNDCYYDDDGEFLYRVPGMM